MSSGFLFRVTSCMNVRRLHDGEFSHCRSLRVMPSREWRVASQELLLNSPSLTSPSSAETCRVRLFARETFLRAYATCLMLTSIAALLLRSAASSFSCRRSNLSLSFVCAELRRRAMPLPCVRPSGNGLLWGRCSLMANMAVTLINRSMAQSWRPRLCNRWTISSQRSWDVTSSSNTRRWKGRFSPINSENSDNQSAFFKDSSAQFWTCFL